MKLISGLGAVAVSLLAFTSTSQAQQSLVSLQYNSNSISANGYTAGVFATNKDWNADTSSVPYFAPGSATKGDLLDSNGNDTGIVETLDTYGHYGPNGQSTGFGAGNDALYNSAEFTNYDNGKPGQAQNNATLSLFNLDPTLVYSLLLYTTSPQPGGGTALTATVGNLSYYYTTSLYTETSFVRATNTDSTMFPVANYVEFDGLVPDGSNSLSLTLGPTTNGVEVNGFQLVGNPPAALIPEPSTVCLMGLGLVGIVCVVRRKRHASI